MTKIFAFLAAYTKNLKLDSQLSTLAIKSDRFYKRSYLIHDCETILHRTVVLYSSFLILVTLLQYIHTILVLCFMYF